MVEAVPPLKHVQERAFAGVSVSWLGPGRLIARAWGAGPEEHRRGRRRRYRAGTVAGRRAAAATTRP
eukprot:15445871-Alexandrium_andersonii.AAC.1